MELFKDKQSLKTFAMFNMMNAGLLMILGFYNYMLTPKLIAIGQQLGLDTSSFPFYARLFPALTVLFVFITNGLYLYSSTRTRERSAGLMLLPAVYLFGANAVALLLPFAQLPEAKEYFWMIGAMVAGFSLLIPVLEIRRRRQVKEKNSSVGDRNFSTENSNEGDFGHHLVNLPNDERKALSEAMLQNCSIFIQFDKEEELTAKTEFQH